MVSNEDLPCSETLLKNVPVGKAVNICGTLLGVNRSSRDEVERAARRAAKPLGVLLHALCTTTASIEMYG